MSSQNKVAIIVYVPPKISDLVTYRKLQSKPQLFGLIHINNLVQWFIITKKKRNAPCKTLSVYQKFLAGFVIQKLNAVGQRVKCARFLQTHCTCWYNNQGCTEQGVWGG